MNLALSGGGVRCLAMIGVFSELNKRCIKINKISSTSGGSICGLLYCLGLTEFEMLAIAYKIDWADIVNFSIKDLFTTLGLSATDKLKEALYSALMHVNYSKNITLIELYDKCNILFEVSGYCLNTHQSVFFNYLTHPEMEVVQAVVLSSSVPILFQPTCINNQLYVDGGVNDNYPIQRFPKDDPNTIGIILESEYECDATENIDIATIMCTIISGMHNKLNDIAILHNKNNTIIIKPTCIESFDFGISDKDIIELYSNGVNEAQEYFNIKAQTFFLKKPILPFFTFYLN